MQTKNEAAGGARRVGRECLSDLQLDQMELGELDGVTNDRARLHLAQCGVCKEAWEALVADRRAFAEAVDVPRVAARIVATAYPSGGRVKRWLRGLALPAALAAAAASALVLLAQPLKLAPTERIKGGAGAVTLATYVKYAGHEQPGSLYMGEPLRVGDRVQFRISTAAPGHLAILSIDGRGDVSVFYPSGSTTASVGAGKDQPLGNAVELDESEGTETVVALLCEAERPLADLVTAARKAATQGAVPAPLHTGCVETRTTLTKATPSR
ncbi:MAG: DUF4384 domain-containing protein [Deltaproteobacteria bacterium]|nr:DUF4384 domain-containing protein [Deltaproteobacteria bacterium]